MKRQSFGLQLLMLIVLGTSLNACMVASYQITAQESFERKTILESKYDEPVYFVIPRYYVPQICPMFSRYCKVEDLRDILGTQIYNGVSMALDDMPLGKQVEFTEHIRSQGLVCVVTVNEQLNDDTPYSEILSVVTLSAIPAYTTRKYVLSYSLLLDYKTVKEYEYHITEKAIFGLISWMLFPVVYPFWSGIEIDQNPVHGPRAGVVKEATREFLLDARRDGIL